MGSRADPLRLGSRLTWGPHVSDSLRRFQHLERPRPDRGDPADGDPAPTPGRFEGVERPAGGGPAAPARSGARLERFGPEPEPRLELAAAEGRQPFTRCMRCGTDASVSATECPHCAASLDTPEQRAFDGRLWAAHQAEAAREAEAIAERRVLQDRAAAEDAAQRRAAYEALAREVGERERQRLAPRATPLAFRLLERLPARRTRIAVGVLLLGGLLGLAVAGVVSRAHGGRGTALGAALALAVLLLAPRWRGP